METRENQPTANEVPGVTTTQSWINQMRAVTISREYGSGGGEIAVRLAARLGWHLVNHEVVLGVARALGISETEAEAHDEHVDTLASRILSSLSMAQSAIAAPLPVQLTTDEPAYDEARRRVVEGAIATGHVVIIGRGAQVLLASRRDVLHVRIIAPLEQRIEYVMRREGLNSAAARHRVEAKDRDRSRFLMSVHRKNPADASLYDLVVNTGVLHLNSVVDLLMLALERKATRVTIPSEDLGPSVGLAPYTGSPGDIGSASKTTE
jgi:cytidylate kinase